MENFFSDMSFSTVMSIIYGINFICAIALVFVQRKDPDATLAWIMVLFFVPIVGLVFYLVFSQNIARMKIFKINRNEMKMVIEDLTKQEEDIEADRFVFQREESRKWKDLITLNQKYDGSFFSQNNDVTIYTDGNDLMDDFLADIHQATETIDLEYFILKRDETGRRLLKALEVKAAEGVKVRILLDAMGSRRIGNRELSGIRNAGGECAFFFKPKLKVILMRLNYRNHRKLAIIDGTIGYIGGFNVGNEYVDQKEKFGHWRDTHARIKGNAVFDIKARFALDWRSATGESEEYADVYVGEVSSSGNSGVQIVSSGPDSEEEQIKAAYLRMITSAKKQIYLQTPYYVPDMSIHEALKVAAYSGVDVKIMIPNQPDHIFVYWATYSYVGDLLRSGVKAYIYDNGFLHSKTLIVDGEVASVGSANFDKRSFRLNFEANAIIYDWEVSEKLTDAFKKDMEKSRELTKEIYDNRPFWIIFKESFSRLLSDIL